MYKIYRKIGGVKRKMKKILSLFGAALLALTITGGQSYAAERTNEDYQFNWDEAWGKLEKDPNYYPQSVDFVVEDDSDNNNIKARSAEFERYATGKTQVRFHNYYVYSKGTTKGEHLMTTTSAYAGLRNATQSGITVYGVRDTALAFGTAVSEAKKKYIPLDLNLFIGMTVHTATMKGSIYEKATSDRNFY